MSVPEIRLILIGGRWAGKSSSGNTILGKGRFECGRTRTAQSEVRHVEVRGRKLTVVDVPGWQSSLSLREVPEVDKQRFKLNPASCLPGPHAFLIVIPIDSAFSVEQRKTVEEHMKLLGERAWRYSMVLFTCGDFLGDKTVEQHIESEGDALRWLVEKCQNRYHVFNNKERSNASQVTRLLEKVEEMKRSNHDCYYKLDEQTFRIIQEKQQEVAARAEERRRRAEEQTQRMRTHIPAGTKPSKLQMILLGSRSVGKTSVGNTILGIKEQEDGKRTAHSVARQGFVGKTEITLVDTPGWWKGFPACDTPEAIKEQVMRSMFLCPPGPHVFLLVIDADESFSAKHLDALTTHVELLGEGVWMRTIVVFTRGDWLGKHSIEEYIEGEGEALQSLLEQCDNRYHVIDNKNMDDGTQVRELLEKIFGTVARNGWGHFVPDENILSTIVERERRVEEAVKLRRSQTQAKSQSLRGSRNRLPELRIVMLGQKTTGKSATGNNLLRKEVFATCQNEQCRLEEAHAAGRRVTVVDTPGWWQEASRCTEKMDREIARGLTLSGRGLHAVLLVVPLDLTFREVQRAALEDHMSIFDDSIWKHTIVLFTFLDKLADASIEEHIEREHEPLRWLVDKCENKYLGLNNTRKTDLSQVTEIFEKIEEVVALNDGRLFCPDANDINLRIDEKFKKRQVKNALKRRLEHEYRRRELELMMDFKQTLLQIQEDIGGTKPTPTIGDMAKFKAVGQRRRDSKEKKQSVEAKIDQEIDKLNQSIMRSTELLRGSMDFLLPSMSGDSPAPSIAGSERRNSASGFHKVLGWLSELKIGRQTDNQMTLNFSQSSGYRSEFFQDYFNRGSAAPSVGLDH